MRNRILILLGIIVLIVIAILVVPTKEDKWTYGLPNHYVLSKIGKDNIIIGKYVDNKLVTKKDDKTIGISEYVEAFGIDEDYNYIYARTLTNKNDLEVNYYIIDSKEEKVYGSYELEGFLNKLEELKLDIEVQWKDSIKAGTSWEE